MNSRITFTAAAVLCAVALSAGNLNGNVSYNSPEVSLKKTRNGYEALAVGFFHAEPSTVWKLLVDHEKAPDYLDSIKQSRILSRNGNKVIIEQTVSLILKGGHKNRYFSNVTDE